jgi:hypothetical protein
MLTEATLYEQLLSALDGANEVVAATLLYDDPDLHAKFLRRLQARALFTLELLVDRQASSLGHVPLYAHGAP